MSDHDDLILSNSAWLLEYEQSLDLLEDNAEGQLALWPVEDLLGTKRYIACPRRGAHERLTECWACWCDVTYGYATAAQVLSGEVA